MGRYQAILFDMDGTLLDTLTDMQDAVNHVLAAHGLPLRTLEEVRRFVGNGAGPLIHRALPEGYPQEQKVLAEYRAYYQAHNCIRTCPYPGIPELLEQLRQRGLKLAVVSNKPDEAVRALRADFFADAVPIAVGETAAIRRKPAPDMLLAAMEKLGADPDKTVFVGDSEVDIATARAANLPCISVLWGFRDRDVLERAGAQQFAADIAQLQALLG